MAQLRQLYVSECGRFQVKVNSGVKDLLPESSELSTLDVSSTLVGANGVKPVLEVLKAAPGCHTVILRAQRITSDAAQEVAEVLKGHPGVTTIDLSENHCPLAGPALLDMVKGNKRIITLDIANTAVRPMFVNLITMQLGKNSSGAPQAQPDEDPFGGGGAPKSPEFGSFDPGTFNPESEAAAADTLRPPSGKAAKRRPTVCSERITDNDIDAFSAPVIDKPSEVTEWLCALLEYDHLFSHLDDRDIGVAVGAMEQQKFKRGDKLKEEGKDGDDKWYIIWSGECDQTVEECVKQLRKGDSFGGLQLMHACPMQSTVEVTSSECVVYCTTRPTYRGIVAKASKAKRERYGGFLSNVGFLKGMSDAERNHLADALKSVKSAAGESIIKYGDEGQWFHIIEEGTVEVIGRKDGQEVKVCEFKEGDCVGELEFINNHKCVADVKCVGEVRSAKMNRKHFEMCMGPVLDVLRRTAAESTVYEYYRGALEEERGATAAQREASSPTDGGGFGTFGVEVQAAEPGDAGRAAHARSDSGGGHLQTAPRGGGRRRFTVSAEVITADDMESFQPNVIPKDDAARDFIVSHMERIPIFCHLEDFELGQLAMAMARHQHEKGSVIVSHENEGEHFHLIHSGEVTAEPPDEEPRDLKPGQFFGQEVLLYPQPYPYSVRAASHDTSTFSLDRMTYKHIMQKASMKKRAMYTDFLKGVGFLKSLGASELCQLADALKPSQYRSGESLITYGDEGVWFYIIVEGTVEVFGRDKDMNETKVCEFQVGDCVGELEFIHNHTCVADVKAKGDVRAAKMHRYHFEMCMGPIVDILKQQAGESEVYEYYRQTVAGQNAPIKHTTSIDFKKDCGKAV